MGFTTNMVKDEIFIHSIYNDIFREAGHLLTIKYF